MEQSFKDAIKAKANEYTSRLVNDPAAAELVEQLAKVLTEEIPLDDRLVAKVKSSKAYDINNFFNSVFNHYWLGNAPVNYWKLDSPVVQQFIHRRHLSNTDDAISNIIRLFIIQWWEHEDANTFADFLRKQQFSDKDIVSISIEGGDDLFFETPWRMDKEVKPYDRALSAFGKYLVPLLKPSSGFLGFGKSSDVLPIINEALTHRANASARTGWLALLCKYAPDSLPKDVSKFLVWRSHGSKDQLNIPCAIFLIREDVARFESAVLNTLVAAQVDEGKTFYIYQTLNTLLNGKYDKELRAIGEKHLDYFKGMTSGGYYHEPMVSAQQLVEAYFDYLHSKDPAEATERLKRFFAEAEFLNYKSFYYIVQKYPDLAVDLLIVAVRKDPDKIVKYSVDEYYRVLFESLEKVGAEKARTDLVQFAAELAGKRTREIACALIAKMGDAALDDGRRLLGGKTVGERVTGALILSQFPSLEARTALNEGVDEETNDDTRDIMLESLAEDRFSKPLNLSQVKEMITLASKRKKLNKWSEKWIEETAVPELRWKETDEILDASAVRFLFYRMKRATGLNSDIEARQAIAHIDRETSGDFAKSLLKAFQDSNADVKIKYYLTMAALLGDNEMMSNLNSLFTKSMTDKRMKMAEYVVGALAMVGTDKALRLVETIYRKYASKKPAVSEAARGALDAAAKELNLTMDELSDRIIPNFDFDGIYKTITIDGDEYRAFVNDEFKVNYLTDDNKIRKSLPSAASKEMKAEFKDIEKEIGVVSKSQTVRLEKYLVEERRWTSDDWTRFFFNNPIMSVYAMKLLWSVFDQNGKLLKAFYCSQDGSLYDIQDEEVSLEADHTVGILHPIYLSADQLESWKQKLYDMSMTTVFPILDRAVITVIPAEAELNRTQLFLSKNIPKGADFVNTYLVKKNWIKSTGDGGMSEFAKLYKDGLIRAQANIEGPTAWYQGGTTPAKMYDVSFWSKTARSDIKLKDLPPVFFSEVMSDIESMINAN
ncbi:DUF4132 domain-containing protein [Chryseolinea sp. T2]|uniref:DUF4132 domain-containing protein n=1 Tax=Chryseolinea sp. T2 TaxID=3129255 RepID=UPI003077D08E